MRKRVLCLLLALLMMFGTVTAALAADVPEQTLPAEPGDTASLRQYAGDAAPAAQTDGRFAFVAATSGALIVAPEYINYTAGQTVWQALEASRHTFTLDSSDFVSSIDGISGNFSRLDSNGGYALDQPAANVTGFFFVGFDTAKVDSAAFTSMVSAMADYLADDSGVQNYPAAKAAYQTAYDCLFTKDGAYQAAADALRAAIKEYNESVIGGETVIPALTFQTLAGGTLTGWTFQTQDAYGRTQTFTAGETIRLVPGNYQFTLLSGFDGASGTMELAADGSVTIDGSAVTELRTPKGAQWVAMPVLHRESGGTNDAFAVLSDDAAAHSAVYRIADAVSRVYITAKAGSDLNQAGGTYTTQNVLAYARYTMTDGTEYLRTRPWESTAAVLTKLIDTGKAGTALTVEAQCTLPGYMMFQRYSVEIQRGPTLSSLTVAAAGVTQAIGFAPETTAYDLTVTSDNLTLLPQAMDADYRVSFGGVTIAAGQPIDVPLNSGENTISLTVENPDGLSSTYTLNVQKTAATGVRFDVPADTQIQVFNGANAEIGAEADGSYALTPGERYTYTATKDTWYHTSAAFTAAAGLRVSVAEPETADHMTALTLRDRTRETNAQVFLPADKFHSAQHEYTIAVEDIFTSLYVGAEKTGGYVLSAVGCTTPVDTGTLTSAKLIRDFLKRGSAGQTLTLRLAKTVDAVTYYQDYAVQIQKRLTLTDGRGLSLKIDGESTQLFVAEDGTLTDDKNFYNDSYDYGASVVRAAQAAQLTVRPYAKNYYIMVNGTRYDFDRGSEGEQLDVITVTLPLDSGKDSETLAIAVCCEDESAISQTYTVLLEKKDAIATQLNLLDESGKAIADAMVTLLDMRSGKRVWPDAQGLFRLVDGMTYRYTATCNGYCGVQAELTAGSANAVVSITMKKAQSGAYAPGITSRWSSFRGNQDANGVVADKTPIAAENAVLNWANPLGEGYSSEAVSCPILIAEDGYDYLIVYARDKLYKVDALSGTVVCTGQMLATSSFAINTPTFADGMIFVGLANGMIQAFRADTLESLWVYQDALKGQPNCPITYYNGYIYTGFWQSETADANYVCLSVTDEDPTSTTEQKLPRWTYTSKGGFYWAGAYVCDDFLLVGTDDGQAGYLSDSASLLCLDAKSGAELDRIDGLRGDIRSNISHADGRYYFTSKGGYFYSVAVNKAADGTITLDKAGFKPLYLDNGGNDRSKPPMSTCTPVVYNGRAYIGVSGVSQFGAYSGHNITVIDLSSNTIAYTVPTQGYPQTSGLLTTAHSDGGYAYVYFFDNFTPGKLRVLKDRPGQRAPLTDNTVTETYLSEGKDVTVTTPYVLFTPADDEAQYAICSPISDQYGTLYFKNDSARLMALSNTITKITVKKQPDKLSYSAGETFDPSGMELEVTYANGLTRAIPVSRTVTDPSSGKKIELSYFKWKTEPLTAEDTDFQIMFAYSMYQDRYDGGDGKNEHVVKFECDSAAANLQLEIKEAEYTLGDVTKDGKIDGRDVTTLRRYLLGLTELDEAAKKAADVTGDGKIDGRDVTTLRRYLLGLTDKLGS